MPDPYIAVAAKDAITLYAAVVATVALGWQVFTELRRRRPNLEVQVRHAGPWGRMMVEHESSTVTEGRMRVPEEYELHIVVINKGETPQYVDAITLEPPTSPGQRPDPPYWHEDLDAKIEPNAQLKRVIPVSKLSTGEGSAAGLRFVAYAMTASGKRVDAFPDEVTPDFVRLSEENQP